MAPTEIEPKSHVQFKIVYASSELSCETVQMRRLVKAFAIHSSSGSKSNYAN